MVNGTSHWIFWHTREVSAQISLWAKVTTARSTWGNYRVQRWFNKLLSTTKWDKGGQGKCFKHFYVFYNDTVPSSFCVNRPPHIQCKAVYHSSEYMWVTNSWNAQVLILCLFFCVDEAIDGNMSPRGSQGKTVHNRTAVTTINHWNHHLNGQQPY